MSRLELNGASLYYETEGEASAPALLLVHAGIANLRMWDPQVAALAASHHVIRYDSRGFGQTTSDDVEFSERADALALLDHLGVDRATIIGCSRGGRLAIDLAVDTPQRVSGLVVIGGGPSGFPDVELTEAEDAAIDLCDAAYERQDWAELSRLEVKLWSIGVGRDESTLDPQFVRTAYELDAANLRSASDRPVPMQLEPPAYDRVVDVTVPTLVVVGDHDLSEALAQYEYLLSTIPRADGCRFPDSAHLPSVEHPDEFARVLLRWLDEHSL
ncbi:pimeloyl-ACP methyl ester carboxylesterase [Homoserinimonas aerilata]|uniref:Pimeloyl-ACP methyl ester carboxylesterase n=1 Tax=Homoserinimonas aerilata TaxID=1162970 RepID=A0A542YF96_9MICO|nr:alpha/beta fold hydrolase [Homoserinimonas aerilata]TQL46742.1 pimeloyl-ACP methyl ester carboxylesterase [Homoserinimonas aerilata]